MKWALWGATTSKIYVLHIEEYSYTRFLGFLKVNIACQHLNIILVVAITDDDHRGHHGILWRCWLLC
jgi:hypothetical protein